MGTHVLISECLRFLDSLTLSAAPSGGATNATGSVVSAFSGTCVGFFASSRRCTAGPFGCSWCRACRPAKRLGTPPQPRWPPDRSDLPALSPVRSAPRLHRSLDSRPAAFLSVDLDGTGDRIPEVLPIKTAPVSKPTPPVDLAAGSAVALLPRSLKLKSLYPTLRPIPLMPRVKGESGFFCR